MATKHPYEIYKTLSMGQQRALVSFIVEQGRHLENLDEWTMEDNRIATETLVDLYKTNILPLEDADKRCTCGNERHVDEPTMKKPMDLLPGDMWDAAAVYDELEERGLLGDDPEVSTDRMISSFEYRLVAEKPDDWEDGSVRVPCEGETYFLPPDIDVPVYEHDTSYDG